MIITVCRGRVRERRPLSICSRIKEKLHPPAAGGSTERETSAMFDLPCVGFTGSLPELARVLSQSAPPDVPAASPARCSGASASVPPAVHERSGGLTTTRIRGHRATETAGVLNRPEPGANVSRCPGVKPPAPAVRPVPEDRPRCLQEPAVRNGWSSSCVSVSSPVSGVEANG
ncbi:hypothetical protein INR49_007991 [Caranx melampygus]|nr:hypothetical protein INR49_007991 [Caranx melampygus]